MRGRIQLLSLVALLTVFAGLAVAQTSDAQKKIRNVTPDNIPVIVLPPRSEQKNKSKSQPDAPIAEDGVVAAMSEDGTVSINGKALRFAGVARIPSDTLCEAANGGRWACGLRAYIALRNLVHGKEIKCEKLAERADGTLSRCYRERINISEWLLTEGWALYDDAAKDDMLAAAMQDAQKHTRGIWANGSRPAAAKP